MQCYYTLVQGAVSQMPQVVTSYNLHLSVHYTERVWTRRTALSTQTRHQLITRQILLTNSPQKYLVFTLHYFSTLCMLGASHVKSEYLLIIKYMNIFQIICTSECFVGRQNH